MFNFRNGNCQGFITWVAALLLALFGNVAVLRAQTTAFTYQGKFTDAGQSANGVFDLQFALFDALNAGAPQGATFTREDVVVANGVFTVQLDFGAGAFPGAARFLEIGVRPGASTGAFTTLTPRQPVQATPYAIRSLSAAQADNATNATTAVNFSGTLAGEVTGVQSATQLANNVVTNPKLADASVTDAKIVDVAGSKITGLLPVASVPPGSTRYIQNTLTQQAVSNFNISGDGTAGGTLNGNIVNATAQFNLNNNRVLANAGTNNLFAGVNAGAANTAGQNNAFFGTAAGAANTTGGSNVFFGANAGAANTSGGSNLFAGAAAGTSNTGGNGNTMLGALAGSLNASGSNNVFVGTSAGTSNSTGFSNAFFGQGAGTTNTTGNNNTLLGQGTSLGANNLSFATAIGSGATVQTSNTIVLGRSSGDDLVRVLGNLSVEGAYQGNGSQLINLNASSITSGTLNNNRLGIVPPNKGGTGLGATGAAGNYLRSDGTNWTSAALQAADLPTGSSAYIQNTTAPQASSNFNLSGTGTANILNAATQFNLNGNRILANAGTFNLFAGVGAGTGNTSGGDNAFFGAFAGQINSTGSGNAFFGKRAGIANSDGNNNSYFGMEAGGGLSGGNNNTFIGQNAGALNSTGDNNTLIGQSANLGGGGFSFATAIGSQAAVTESNRIQLGRNGQDTVSIGALTSASATHVCINGTVLSSCSSSQRYKQNVQPLRAGLNLIQRLQPVTFDWKERQEHDLGLIAEEVGKVEPLLVTRNQTGVIEGVKYDQLSVVLINAVQEQQAQIAAQQRQIVALQKLVCRTTRRAKVCRTNSLTER